jgi:hypothetical protein
MNTLKFLVVFITLFVFNCGKAQNDIIITVKGEKINCFITKEDSAKVYFKVGGNLSSVEATISRNEIQSIQYGKKQELPTLTVNPDHAVHDDYVAPTASVIHTASLAPPRYNKNNLSLYIGLSNPVGKFQSENLDTNEIGPAKKGQAIGLGFTHLIKRNYGIILNAFYASNELNTQPVTAKYKTYTDSVWSASRVNWQSYGINFGYIFHYQFKSESLKDLSFNTKLNGGYMSLIYPDVKLSVSSSNYLQFEKVTADAFSIGAGIGLGYRVLQDLNVIVELNYLQARVKYNEILVQGETPATPYNKKISLTKRDITQQYQTVFLNAGLSYWF